jgi:hypothetical protein
MRFHILFPFQLRINLSPGENIPSSLDSPFMVWWGKSLQIAFPFAPQILVLIIDFILILPNFHMYK